MEDLMLQDYRQRQQMGGDANGGSSGVQRQQNIFASMGLDPARPTEPAASASAPSPQPQPMQQPQPQPQQPMPPPPPPAAAVTPSSARMQRMMGADRQPTRQNMRDFATDLSKRRRCRAEVSRRLADNPELGAGISGTNRAQDLYRRVLNDGGNEHQLSGSQERVAAIEAANAALPQTQDILNAGYSEQFLCDILDTTRHPGKESADRAAVGEWQLASAEFTEGFMGTRIQGWEYMCLSGDGDGGGARDLDFCWRTLRTAESRKRKHEERVSSGGGDTDRQHWTVAARHVADGIKKARTAFDTQAAVGITDTAMRDTIYLVGQRSEHNECRMAVQRDYERRTAAVHAAPSSAQGASAREAGTMFYWNQEKRMSQEVAATAKKNEIPAGRVYTTLRFEDLASAESLPRVGGLGLGTNDRALSKMETRRDAIARTPGVLKALYVPTRFEKGVPFKMYNGQLYVNTFVMAEHAALVVEMSAFLASVPGIFRGHFGGVPASFRTDDRAAVDDDVAGGGDGAAAASGTSSSAAGTSAAGRVLDARAILEAEAQSEVVRLNKGRVGGVADDVVRSVRRPKPPEAQQRAQEERAARSGGVGGDALPGGNAQAQREERIRELAPDALVPQMPYLPDMIAKFLTLQAGNRLVKDEKARQWVRALYEDYKKDFDGQTYAEVCRDEVQLSLRFVGAPPDASSVELYPLSHRLPLVETATLAADRHRRGVSGRAGRGGQSGVRAGQTLLTEQYLSFYEGKKIEADDEEFQDFQASRFGRQAIKHVTGNVYAMSTWTAFTVRALQERGMFKTEDQPRVNDAGHFVLNRLRMIRGKKNRDARVAAQDKEEKRLQRYIRGRREAREREIAEARAARAATPPRMSEAAFQNLEDRHENEEHMEHQYIRGEVVFRAPETPEERNERVKAQRAADEKRKRAEAVAAAKKRKRDEVQKDWTEERREADERRRAAKAEAERADEQRAEEYEASLHLDLPALHRESTALAGTWEAWERRQTEAAQPDEHGEFNALRSERALTQQKRKWQEDERQRQNEEGRLPIKRSRRSRDEDEDGDEAAADDSDASDMEDDDGDGVGSASEAGAVGALA